MAKIRITTDGGYSFTCPGCKEDHSITNGWKFTGDKDCPTFTPSVLVKSGHFVDKRGHDHPCWCDYNDEQVALGKEPSGNSCQVCHSYITNGQIQFLSDSTHELVGQTVPLPEWIEYDARP